MNNEEIRQEKKVNMKSQHGKWKTSIYKALKSKVDSLEDAVFESGAVKHAAQFTKTLEEIANYVQKKYNSDVAKMIKDVERSVFEFPARPLLKTILNSDGRITQEKVDEMDIYVWKKDYELIHSKKAEFVE